MRIAMIHTSFAIRGGAERYLRNLAATLVDRGHVVRVVCRPSENGQPTDHHVRTGLLARLATGSPRLNKIFRHLGDLIDPTALGPHDLRDFRPDVVHVHNWQGLGVIPVARLSRTYPTCHTVHDHAICDPSSTMASLGRSRLLDALLAIRSTWITRRLRRCVLLWPSPRTRDNIHRWAPSVARIPSRALPLAVPDPRSGLAIPRPRSGRPEPAEPGRSFLYLGVLSGHKGVDLLLAAWQAAGHQPGDRLLIAGDGPLRGDVERLAATTPSVRYLGFLDEVGKWSALRDASWLVFPSQCAENFPLVCVEALRAGKPVIASEIARPPMASAESVLLFRDQHELGHALERAARMSDREYHSMAAAARADGDPLDWDRHVDAVLAMYAEIRTASGIRHPIDDGSPR